MKAKQRCFLAALGMGGALLLPANTGHAAPENPTFSVEQPTPGIVNEVMVTVQANFDALAKSQRSKITIPYVVSCG